MVTTDFTESKKWCTEWLFKRTLQDLDNLLNLTFGEEGYEKLKAARQLVINEAGRFSNGATPKMDVQLPGAGFERYEREPNDTAFIDDVIVCQGCGSTSAQESSVRFRMVLSNAFCNDCAIERILKPITPPAIPPTTSESSFGDWLTTEDEEAYTDLQKDDIVERQSRIAREGSVKYAPALAELAKPTLDFTGRWKTREGGIAGVGAQNRDDWNEEGRHRHDTNLDLMERLRDGGNRSF